jgi:integrative and conjugative element protein (TIGR02256 family)
MLKYGLEVGQQKLCISDEVLDTFRSYRQVSRISKEAGGQLFATFEERDIVIRYATGIRQGDKRGWNFFRPNRNAERIEISEAFQKGLHYVGDWHTHPQAMPKPSGTDIKNIQDCYSRSKHSLNHFVLIIVGTQDVPAGLSVSIHNSSDSITLSAM